MQHGARSVASVECLAGRGIHGDRYFEKRVGHKGQVTLMSLDAIEEIRRQFNFPDLSALVFRRNLIVSGLDLADLIGKRFKIHGVSFQRTQECTPCHWMDRVVAVGARDFKKQNFRGGLRAKLLSDGSLTCDGA